MSLPNAWSASSNLAEYNDPALYDLENPAAERIDAFLLSLAQGINAPVLELGCGTGRFTIPLARRRFFPQELEALLHYNGFKTLHCYGDWDYSELTNTSPMMIFVCQAMA